jgi:hypothetical protein
MNQTRLAYFFLVRGRYASVDVDGKRAEPWLREGVESV